MENLCTALVGIKRILLKNKTRCGILITQMFKGGSVWLLICRRDRR